MDTDSFVLQMETENFYRKIEKDLETKFDTSGNVKGNNRPL